MDSTLDDKLMEGQLASLDEQLSNLSARTGSQSFGPAGQHQEISRPAGNDSSIGELAPRGFRRFSVGSIHWCCCLVVVVLRSYGDDGPLGPSTSDTGRRRRKTPRRLPSPCLPTWRSSSNR